MKKNIIAAAVASVMSVSAFAQWTETNMGFESGNTSGWTISDQGTMTGTITSNG